MFERFTERARFAVVKAQEAARELDHGYVGSEHLLLGLLADPTELPAQVLSDFGIDAEKVRAEVLRRVGRGKEPPAGPQIPFTPRAKKILELGLREALSLGHNMIGTGHVMLGLLREGEGLATSILESLGAESQTVRVRLVELLGGPDTADEPRPRIRRVVEGEFVFTVKPDERLRRLLMEAGGRALREERDEFGVEELLDVINDMPEIGELPE